MPDVVQALTANGVNTKKIQLLGTGLWDDPRIFATPALDGGWYAAPDAAGYRNFSARYRARYKQDPARTATLAYDAVALDRGAGEDAGSAARFLQQVLTNPSGFTGIDGLFRFRPDGTNERGLAVLAGHAAGRRSFRRRRAASARQASKLASKFDRYLRRRLVSLNRRGSCSRTCSRFSTA